MRHIRTHAAQPFTRIDPPRSADAPAADPGRDDEAPSPACGYMVNNMDRCHPRALWHLLASLVLVTSVMAGEAPLPIPGAKPLTGGWTLRTGVNPRGSETASFDAKGVLTIAGGGERTYHPRGTAHPADRARFTAAFVYKAFAGDFILTARRIAFDHGTGHENSGAGLAVVGDLQGWDTPTASNNSGFDGKPVWFRMIRKGDRLGLYEGPDGQRWMASNAGAQIAGTVYAGLYTESWWENSGTSTASFDSISIDENPKFTYATTWLGNEFEGGPTNTVNSSMIGLAVAPDGTCITTGINGEQENEMGRFRDGQVLTVFHGARVGGSGNAVTVMADGNGLVAKGAKLQRFDWDGNNSGGETSAKLDDSEGNETIRGLAVFENEVFVAVRPANAVIVLDLANLKEKRRISCERPGPLSVDAKGVLWVVEEGWTTGHPYSHPYPKPFRVLGLDRTSGKQLGEITGVELPSAICADAHGPSKARLLIADNGVDQQIKIFDVSGAKPKAAGTLGAKGGVYAGTAGQMKPGKLFGISGVGSDAKGTIYVSTAGFPYRVVMAGGMPNISQLKAFAPSAIDKPEPEAIWSLTCPGFNCMGACWDAKTGDAYIGGLARYGYDAKRGLGAEWQIDGITADLRNEADGESLMRTFLAAPELRWIDNQRFLFLRDRCYRLDQHGNLGRLVRMTNSARNVVRDQAEHIEKGAADRFSLEALFGRFPAELPAQTRDKDGNATDWKRWEWLDGQGGPRDGKQQTGEYRDLTAKIDAHDEENCWAGMDDGLDQWWQGPDKKDLQRRRFAGLKDGVPTWSDDFTSFPLPTLVERVYGASYQSSRDIMDLACTTVENPGGHYQISEVQRYADWSNKPRLTARIVFMQRGVSIPWGGEGFWQVPNYLDKVVGWSVAGDVLYATNRTGAIRAYDLTKGNLIEWMDAGPEVFASAGFFDVSDTAVKAYAVSPTEQLILRQSNWTIRILAHRWNPAACTSGRLPPAPEVVVQSHSGEVELRWGGRTGITGTVKGFQIYRAEKEKGPFKKLSLCTEASFRDKRPDGKSAWYRVATVNLVGEGPQSEPRLGAAATASAKRVNGRGKIGADGFDLATRGDWQGAYGADGVYLVQDLVAKGEPEAPRRDFLGGYVTWPGSRGKAVVEASDDRDRLQSMAAPGKRCPNEEKWWSNQWGPVVFQFSITDGRPRQIAIAYARNATFVLRDVDTGAVLGEERVAWPKDDISLGYIAFDISGNVRLEMTGDAFRAVFIDPVPGGK